ncbi:gluconate:H+ symporter [Altererythrobacter sp. ZODW24]|uniref:GntP family permease n=1 Tax=Altererythrobacter sp. ZODW24 TaxID=2185142 RepID=UPI000DF7F9DC|nr:gluconate:H+ symporter [Altererythrobacter sp. ZODW24]
MPLHTTSLCNAVVAAYQIHLGDVDISWIIENRALLSMVMSILALLVLIMRAKMHPFPALLIAGLAAALGAGLAPSEAITAVANGMGGTLGGIAAVIGLGAMFGVLVEHGGGVTALARYVTRGADSALTRWILGIVGVLVAIPVFFDVAFIILFPLILAFARRFSLAPLAFGLPLLAGLAGAHAFIPPTPGPIAVAQQLQVDLGWVMLFGVIACVPAALVGGPLFASIAMRKGWLPAGSPLTLGGGEGSEGHEQSEFDPGVAKTALGLVLLPLTLIIAGALAGPIGLPEGALRSVVETAGLPVIALLLSCGAAFLAMRPANAEGRQALRNAIEKSLEPVGAVLLVTGAGGAFKQVLVDTGAGQSLADTALSFGFTPIFCGFLIALLLRIAQGSATAAMITAASLTYPIAAAAALTQPQLALVAVAIAGGATACSHVNDSGFWLINRYFGLTTMETLKSWSVSATLTGVTGFVVALILYPFV